jgi:hypothetical protein
MHRPFIDMTGALLSGEVLKLMQLSSFDASCVGRYLPA